VNVEELLIAVRLSVKGVKEGVDEAVAQLRRIEQIKDGLSEELVMRISSAAIEEATRKVQLLRDSGQITREEAHSGYALILEAFEWSEMQKLDIERRMYAIRRQMAAQEVRDIVGEATGRDATTDFAAIINALSELQQRYINDLSIADSIEAEIARNMMERNRKLADMRADDLREEIEAIERRVEISRRSDGIGFGENVHEHGLEAERDAQREIIALIEAQIEFYREMGVRRTEYESLMLERLLEMHRAHHLQLENLEIGLTRERSDALRAEHEAIKQLAIDAAREYFEARLAIQTEALDTETQRFRDAQDERRREMRASFDEEIAALRNQRGQLTSEFEMRISSIRAAADAEIEEHRRRIAEIDEIIRTQGREERDMRDQQRIDIIKDAILFERDEMNVMSLEREMERVVSEMNARREREALQDERRELQDKISEVRQAANREIEILRNTRTEANALANDQAQTKIAALQRSRDEALRALDEETAEGLRHFRQRREDIAEFYRDKLDLAIENANDEKLLLQRSQADMYRFLVSAEVRDNYRRAGQAHGSSYRDIFMQYLDEVSRRIAILAAEASAAGSVVGMAALSFHTGLAHNAELAGVFAAQSFAAPAAQLSGNVDNRTATVNQTFNIADGEVSYFAVKKAATQSLRMILG